MGNNMVKGVDLIAPPVSTTSDVRGVIDSSLDMSIQTRARQGGREGLMSLIPVVYSGLYMPPWWSAARDAALTEFWMSCDHLAGALFSLEAKMTAIEKRIVPLDPSNYEHAREAEALTEVIDQASEYGEGWVSFYGKFTKSLVTQDNGVFVEVIGDGPKSGPIVGRAVSVACLDPSRCTRTGDPNYPVIYADTDGKKYKLHYTRVMFTSQMPSTDVRMNGVGFCGVSRTINVAQTLVDMVVFKQEKMGSRPHQGILITQGGLDPADVSLAFEMAGEKMNSMGLTKYSKIVLTGSSTIMDADIKEITLSDMPDGFDEQTSTVMAMATIALSLGMDARELFPAMGVGATRADALLQHIKQRGKGPGQILQVTEQLFNQKFLPPYLRLKFDFQDDAQDRQVADIKKTRADRWNLSLSSGAMDVRTVREQMVEEGDLTRSQFQRLELSDGRLADGTDITTLFYSDQREIKKYLNLGIADPLDLENNNPEEVMQAIAEKTLSAKKALANLSGISPRWVAEVAIAALDALKRLYEEAEEQERMEDNLMGVGLEQTEEQTEELADGQVRNENLAYPNESVEMDEQAGGEEPENEDETVEG